VIGTRLAKDERPETTMLYQAVVGFLVVTVLTAFDFHVPSWNEVAVGCIAGFFATVASLMQVFAYRHAPASLLAPFTYTQLMWAAGFGFLVFGTVPGPSMLGGAAIIAASGIYTAWRETVRARGAGAA
jgi:drug/metabolite transporter (DMT)-like permease